MKTFNRTLLAGFLAVAGLLSSRTTAQVLFYENFDNLPGPTGGGPGTYVFPSGWTLGNVDNLTPADGTVSYVSDAWIRRADNAPFTNDTCAVSTSWYDTGTADDWMWTPAIALSGGIVQLTWRARAFDHVYRDGYEVRIMTEAPTGSTGNIGNMGSADLLFSIDAENSTWTQRLADLSAYSGQTVYIGFRNNSTDQWLLGIDDVKVSVNYGADAAVASATGYEYTLLPLHNITSIHLSGTVSNSGTQALSEVKLNARIYDESNTLVHTAGSSSIGSLAPLTSQSFSLSPAWIPDAAGSYTIKYFPSQNQTDENDSNDTLRRTVVITSSAFARDNGVVTGQMSLNGPGYLGQVFTVAQPSSLSSVYAQYNPGTPRQYAVSVWRADHNDIPVERIGGTDTLFHPGADTLKATLPIQNGPLVLPPGNYFIADIQFDNTSAIAYCDETFTAFKLASNTSGNWTKLTAPDRQKALVLRMNLDPYMDPTANALHFDGIDDRVDIPDHDALDFSASDTYTLECWIKPSGFSSLAGIISKFHTNDANGYFLRLHADAPYTGIDFDNMKTASGILGANTWYHIAAVNNGGTRMVYVNGVAQALSGTPWAVAPNNDKLALGVDYQNSPRYFNGTIDEVRIWKTARTQAQIQGNMKRRVSPSSSGLVAYYQMDAGTPGGDNTGLTEVTDAAAPGHHGTAERFALAGNTSNWVSGYPLGNIETGNVVYVDSAAAGTNKGDSWVNAYTSLAEAIAFAHTETAVDTILVARGTYYPEYKAGDGTDERDKAFVLPAHVRILGGYPSGGGTRDIAAYPTVLSGDMDGNGIPDNGNAYHVVVAAGDVGHTELNGFTITGGNAEGVSHYTIVNTLSVQGSAGGGIFIYNSGASFTIANCTISGNAANYVGGGIYNRYSSFKAINCTFSGNAANGLNGGSGLGGGLLNQEAMPTLSYCTFSENSAYVSGGGVYNEQSAATFSNCTFFKNTTTWSSGGGMYIENSGPIIADCTFQENSAFTTGGGIHNRSASPTVTGTVFLENSAGNNGGGIYNVLSSPVIRNSTLSENTAIAGGGMGGINNSAATVVNSVFSGNKASSGGGAVYDTESSGTRIINSTLVKNEAGNYGGALFSSASATVVTNSIVYGNTSGTGANILTTGTPAVTVTYSIVEGGYDGAGNSGGDPMFVNAAEGNYRLQACSPAINTGSNAVFEAGRTPDLSSVATDMDGSARIQLGTVDPGAYEAASDMPDGSAALTTAGLSVTLTQDHNGTTYYASDCSTLVAAVTGQGGEHAISGNTTVRVWIAGTQPARYVKRHYEITPDHNADNAVARITLYFTQAEFDAFNALNPVKLPGGPDDEEGIANLLIEKAGGAGSDDSGLPGTYPGPVLTIDPADEAIVWNSVSSRWEVSFEVSGFSGFFVKTSNTALPVRWLSFTGQLNDQGRAVLRWKADEAGVDRYEVERSEDAEEFHRAAVVTAKGNGTAEYSVTDPAPASGLVYYRIRQIDRDGSYSFSTIISLAGREGLYVYPNPSRDRVMVNVPGGRAGGRLYLANAAGIVLREVDIAADRVSVDLTGLPAGIYVVYTSDRRTLKVVKE